MPIESGHYIITNIEHGTVATLTDSNNFTPLTGYYEGGDPGEHWVVKARNGLNSIINLKYGSHAGTGPSGARGETVEGADVGYQWLIQEFGYSGQYTISTLDTMRVWGFDGSLIRTPITLFDGCSHSWCRWTFRRIGSDDDPGPITKANNLAKQEMAKRKEAEAELKIAKEELARARDWVENETRKRAEVESALAVAEEQAEQETAKRREAEAEVVKKVAEVRQAKQEAAQAMAELTRITGNLGFPFITTPKLNNGRYIITNVGAMTVATLASATTGSCVASGVEQDRDTEKWIIVSLSNGKYTIQSVATRLYANHDPNPEEGESVTGSLRPRHWKIRAMPSPSRYVIFSGDMHWSLPDGGEGTLVAFSDQENSPNSQWRFTRVV